MMRTARKARLEKLFLSGVARCCAARVLPGHLPQTKPKGRTILLGAGKAAAEMAATAVKHLAGPVEGCVVTRYGHGVDHPIANVEVIEAGHPIPDENSLEAAGRLLKYAESANEDDRVLFLISGGGSALLTKPVPGLTLDRKQAITQHLLRSGAPVSDINFIRKHLSGVKGGGLSAAATPADQMTFIISDVVGESPEAVASGPTLPMTREPEVAISLLKKYGCRLDRETIDAVRAAIHSSPLPHETRVIATNADALDEVCARLRESGWFVRNLGAAIEGEAFRVGIDHAHLAKVALGSGERVAFVSGGELTVELTGNSGCGGPNLEYLAGMVKEFAPGAAYSAIACDSDGVDGTEDNAGAYIDGESTERFRQYGVDADKLRRTHRTYDLFKASGDLVVTGPTRTNVNDIRILLVNDNDAIAA